MSDSEEESDGEWETDSEEGSEEEESGEEEDSWETDSEAAKDSPLVVLDPENNHALLNGDPLESFAIGSFSIPNPSLEQLTKIEKRGHASFTLDPETNQLFLHDPLPSRNGLFLNEGRVLEPTKLCAGDVIHVGGEPEAVSGEQLTAWPSWSWRLVAAYADPEAAAELLAERAEAAKESQELAAEAAAAILAAEEVANLRKGASIKHTSTRVGLPNAQNEQEGGEQQDRVTEDEGQGETDAECHANADLFVCPSPSRDSVEGSTPGSILFEDGAPWWKRHRNLCWLPEGVREHEQSLVMRAKRWSDDDENNNGGGNGGGNNRSSSSSSRAPDSFGAGWVEEPDGGPRPLVDVGLCVSLAGSFLHLWEIGRVLKSCWHLSQAAAPLAAVTAVSLRRLGEGLLPKSPRKLRDQVFCSRARRKDWGAHAPARVPNGGWHPASFVDGAISCCGRHFGSTLTSLDLSGGLRLSAEGLEGLVCHAPLLKRVVLDRAVGRLGGAGALRVCGGLETFSAAHAQIHSLGHLLGNPSRVGGGGGGVDRTGGDGGVVAAPHSQQRRRGEKKGCKKHAPNKNKDTSPRFAKRAAATAAAALRVSILDADRTTRAANSLTALNVSGTKVCDARPLQHCGSSLRHLNLSHTCVMDLAALAHLAQLEHLDLASCPVVELDPLGSCPRLQFLNLQATKAVGLASLRPCGLLQVLNCSRTPLRFVDGLLGMASLHTLRLADTRVGDLSPLRRCFDLRTVDLSRCPAPLDHVRKALLPNCPRLTTLVAGPNGEVDVLKTLDAREKLERRGTQAAFMRAVLMLRSVQRMHKAKLEAKRAAYFAAVAEATRRARALGNVDADGNVILPPELTGGRRGGTSQLNENSSDSDSDEGGSGSSDEEGGSSDGD